MELPEFERGLSARVELTVTDADTAQSLGSGDVPVALVLTKSDLDPDGYMKAAQLGRTLGVSRERARQIEARAKEKLRQRLQQVAPHAA